MRNTGERPRMRSKGTCGYSGCESTTYLAVASHPKSTHGNTAYWDVR